MAPTDRAAASHCEAATSVSMSGAKTHAKPQRRRRARVVHVPSPGAGMLTWITVHTAVTRTSTQLQMMSTVPRVSSPHWKPTMTVMVRRRAVGTTGEDSVKLCVSLSEFCDVAQVLKTNDKFYISSPRECLVGKNTNIFEDRTIKTMRWCTVISIMESRGLLNIGA